MSRKACIRTHKLCISTSRTATRLVMSSFTGGAMAAFEYSSLPRLLGAS